MTHFRIQRTSPTVYLDGTGQAVNGFQVTVYLPEFDETHLINVENLDPSTVKPMVEKLLTDRQALAILGEETTEEPE